MTTGSRTRITVEAIQIAVAEEFGIPVRAMQSARRGRSWSHPRQAAMYLACNLTAHSLPAIGGFFGGRDHTTVIHALKAVASRRERFPELDQCLARLEEKLRAASPAPASRGAQAIMVPDRSVEARLAKLEALLRPATAHRPAEPGHELQLEFLIGPLFDHAGMIGAAA